MIGEDSTELIVGIKTRALSHWWQRHCKAFCLWYLSLSLEEQRSLLLKACPDLPEQSAFAREAAGGTLLPSDVLLPEFSQEGMLASQGRLFVLFMTRRLGSPDLCVADDTKLLNDLLERGHLPSLSNQQLETLDTPFVDPFDREGNIRSLSAETPAETREQVVSHLKSGRLVRAEVWLALKVRRMSICTLLEAMAEEHYRCAQVKPSPSYAALLAGEMTQQQLALEETQPRQEQAAAVPPAEPTLAKEL